MLSTLFKLDRFLDVLFLGLSSGAIYALVALGLVVSYRGSGHINFAQGAFGTLGAYIAWLFAGWTLPLLHWGIPLWFGTIVAMAAIFAVSAATEVLIVRPLGRRSPFAVLVALVALLLGLDAVMAGIWNDPPTETLGSLFPNDNDDFVKPFGAVVRFDDIGNLVAMIAVGVFLYGLFKFTKAGLAMRAVASNPESSRLVGIPTGRILWGSWGLAGALGAFAGVLYAGAVGTITPTLLANAFIYATAAAMLGGLDSPLGAIVGGLSIGIVENAASEYQPDWVGQEMKLVVALALIVVVLLIRPSGLFGTARVERV